MKYYIYVSDAKVSMLIAQIPHNIKQKIANEFKIDLKILGATRKTEVETEDNRFTSLEAVVSFIRDYGDVGSVDEPGEYVDGCLSMRWGPYGLGLGNKAPLTYFGGVTDETIVGLGGSTKHVIGAVGSSDTHSHSATPFLLSHLASELEIGQEEMSCYGDVNREIAERDADREWPLRAVELATTQMKGVEQKVEFLAKRLLYGRGYSRKKKVLLATPIYVAMAE